MGDHENVEDNVIKMPDLDYVPNPNGIGYELFYSMKRNKGLLAQIDAETGKRDTYDELFRRCVRVAIQLKARGLTSDDIICVCSYNQLNSCVPYLAGLFIGAQMCALDPSISFNDSKHLLAQVKPKIIFVVAEKAEMYEDLLRELSLDAELVTFGDDSAHCLREFMQISARESDFIPEKVKNVFDSAAIMFSSGTTGLAKGICLNHFSLMGQAKNFIQMNFETNICLSFASLYWISAVFLLLQSVVNGTARIICKGFEPLGCWYSISKFKPTFIFMAPNQAIAMLKQGRPPQIDTSSLKDVFIGGAPISPENLLSLRELLPGANVFSAYGQTEVGGLGLTFQTALKDELILLRNKPKSCGRPIPGFWYKVVDLETEKILGPNQTGELRIKTKFQLNGYYKVDSSEAWDLEGWLKTGDVCYYDEDRCFYVVDRIKEMMKFQSWHVAPALLEGILHEHSAVKIAVVVGVPHDEDGEHPLAIVVLSDDAVNVDSEALVEYVNARVDDRQKLRAGVVFVDDVPYTPTGKIKRKFLKERILENLHITKL